MKVVAARIRGTHHNSFRTGEWADIVGVVWLTPEGLGPRAAYMVRYGDGMVDYIALSDRDSHEVGSAS